MISLILHNLSENGCSYQPNCFYCCDVELWLILFLLDLERLIITIVGHEFVAFNRSELIHRMSKFAKKIGWSFSVWNHDKLSREMEKLYNFNSQCNDGPKYDQVNEPFSWPI